METLNIYSPSINRFDSYGLIACQLEKHLTGMGVSVGMLGFDKSMTGYLPYSPHTLYMGWPTMYGAYPPPGDGKRIAISMWESSKMPQGFAPVLNQMDAVIVPSNFCYDLFKAQGVTVPMYMFPLGIDQTYQPAVRPQSDTTTFLAFMDRGRRKGGLVALHAFLLAFGDDPRYQLVLKMRKPGQQVILFDNPNIRLIQQDMSEQELYELYCSCDCMIAANKGEGFGLLPREASASGCITLATNWGGTADDLDLWGWPLSYQLNKADWSGQPGLEGLDLGDWADPCIEDVAKKLRDVADRKEWYAAEAYKKAENLHKLYSWRKFSESVYEVWRGVTS